MSTAGSQKGSHLPSVREVPKHLSVPSVSPIADLCIFPIVFKLSASELLMGIKKKTNPSQIVVCYKTYDKSVANSLALTVLVLTWLVGKPLFENLM